MPAGRGSADAEYASGPKQKAAPIITGQARRKGLIGDTVRRRPRVAGPQGGRRSSEVRQAARRTLPGIGSGVAGQRPHYINPRSAQARLRNDPANRRLTGSPSGIEPSAKNHALLREKSRNPQAHGAPRPKNPPDHATTARGGMP